MGGNRGRGWWNLGKIEVKKIGGNPGEVRSAQGREKFREDWVEGNRGKGIVWDPEEMSNTRGGGRRW